MVRITKGVAIGIPWIGLEAVMHGGSSEVGQYSRRIDSHFPPVFHEGNNRSNSRWTQSEAN